MKNAKETFIRLAFASKALRFGEFTLKSGRKSPYFFNAGQIYTGMGMRTIGQLYADALIKSGLEYEHLFGPAYKGLPIATATAFALAEQGINVTLTFNRKEAKDHGEGGNLIGAPLTGKTIIVDDVIAAGTAFRESYATINNTGAEVTGVVISLDRCERGLHDISTLKEIEAQGIRVVSLITIYDLINFLKAAGESDKVSTLTDYLAIYGDGA